MTHWGLAVTHHITGYITIYQQILCNLHLQGLVMLMYNCLHLTYFLAKHPGLVEKFKPNHSVQPCGRTKQNCVKLLTEAKNNLSSTHFRHTHKLPRFLVMSARIFYEPTYEQPRCVERVDVRCHRPQHLAKIVIVLISWPWDKQCLGQTFRACQHTF